MGNVTFYYRDTILAILIKPTFLAKQL